MTNNYDNTMLDIIVSTGNYKVAPFVKTIMLETPNTNPQAVIAFFHYWDNMDGRNGIWSDENKYLFDCSADCIEDGLIISTETVTALYEEFINIIIFDRYNAMV